MWSCTETVILLKCKNQLFVLGRIPISPNCQQIIKIQRWIYDKWIKESRYKKLKIESMKLNKSKQSFNEVPFADKPLDFIAGQSKLVVCHRFTYVYCYCMYIYIHTYIIQFRDVFNAHQRN